jgi:hypothetical protein
MRRVNTFKSASECAVPPPLPSGTEFPAVRYDRVTKVEFLCGINMGVKQFAESSARSEQVVPSIQPPEFRVCASLVVLSDNPRQIVPLWN